MQTLNDAAVDPTATTLAAAGISALICDSTVDVPQHLEPHSDQILDWRSRLASMVQQQILLIGLKTVTKHLPECTVAQILAEQQLDASVASSMAALTAVLGQLAVSPTSDQFKYLQRMAGNSVQLDDPVYLLISRRLVGAITRATVQQQILTDSWLSSQGLPFAADPIRQMCKEVSMLVQHHCDVLGSLYCQLIKELQ